MHRSIHGCLVAVALSVMGLACDKTEEPTGHAPATPPSAASAAAAQPLKAEPASSASAESAAAAASAAQTAPAAAPPNPALLKPEAAKETAPAKFKAKFSTTKGDFVVEATRAWAPIGVDRFYNLIKLGFYQDTAFFRVVPDFVVQFGIHGTPQVSAAWRPATIQDDPKSKQSNDRGTLTYAKGGPNSRTTQLFINYKDNARLDAMGFPPIGKVIQGIEVVDAINKEYGEYPQQQILQTEGNSYLRRAFANLDYIKSVTLMK